LKFTQIIPSKETSVIFYLLTIGIISILGQVLLLRELTVAFYGIELIYILAIGVWLFWTAFGAVVGRRGYIPSVAVISCLLLIFSILLPLEVVFIRGIRIFFGGIPGSYLPFWRQLAAIIVTLLPVGVLLGLLFQWTAKLYINKNRTLALAYGIESIGGLLGGLASTLFLKAGVQNFTIVILCSLLTVGILLLPGKKQSKRIFYPGISLFCLFLFVLGISQTIDRQMTGWNHAGFVDSRDSPYSRISIEEHAGQFVIFENDALGFETESAAAEELAHLAAINHHDPNQVLLLGGGVEGGIKEVLKHLPQRLDYVELNTVLLDLVQKFLPESYQRPLKSELVTLYHSDPRNFLKNAKTYDLILVGMPEPSSGQSNRFYTREFFMQCEAKLKPDGVLGFRLRSSENIWTRFISYRNTSIYRALTSVFSDVVVLPGVTNIFIASNTPLTRNPSLLMERFKKRNIKTRLITPAYIRYLYTNDRFFDIAKRLNSTNALPNTDIRPVCYRYSSMIWLSKFIPRMINLDISLPALKTQKAVVSYITAIFLMIGLFLVVRRWLRFQRMMLAAIAGFIGMILETMFILYYQVKSGILFQNIGILLMVFMAGLAVGSILIMELAKLQMNKYGSLKKSVGRSLLIGFGLLNAAFIGSLNFNYLAGLWSISILMFITGFLVAGIFAFASLYRVDDQKNVVSPLYAADLIGGCLGSLLGSLILIPLLGMELSAAIGMIISLAAIALI